MFYLQILINIRIVLSSTIFYNNPNTLMKVFISLFLLILSKNHIFNSSISSPSTFLIHSVCFHHIEHLSLFSIDSLSPLLIATIFSIDLLILSSTLWSCLWHHSIVWQCSGGSHSTTWCSTRWDWPPAQTNWNN